MTRRWKSASLRSQLVAIMAVLMVVTVTITGLATIYVLRQILVTRLDADIQDNATAISRYLISGGPAADTSLFRFYGLYLNEDGEHGPETHSEDNFDTPMLGTIDSGTVDEINGRGFDVPGTAPGSKGWRVQVFHIANFPGSVAVAVPLDSVAETVDEAASLVFSVGLLGTLGATGIAYWAVTRQFRPLSQVEKTAAAIAAGDLSRRVEVGNPATEIGRLSRSLNAMLAHIETAFAARTQSEQKMRRFVQDASHELRTPLVTIRGFSELYRHGALQKPEDVEAAMGRIESEAKRMGQLVEDLLTLARVDEQRPLEYRPVDLMILGNDAALDARASAPDREITVVGLGGSSPRSAPTMGDEARLRQVVANLMTNALRYTPAGSPIEVAVGVAPVIHDRMDAVLEVRDHGPGISDEDAARVFERFYRADSSRYRETGGTGLGLAIVAALVAQHDGTVRLTETEGGGATMSIRLPYQPPDNIPDHEDDGGTGGTSADSQVGSAPGAGEDTADRNIDAPRSPDPGASANRNPAAGEEPPHQQ
ncbi:HAMP domain-containing sensor histidine kinase [Arthrobacter sp. Helios]|uniref:sensor histidine kinase n=1 Tax=Arthrobacter sp. Helios TaxID=2828862 RepID=UPI0020677E15|nr:HAMP domain-containing sensor histidine kinase [Arthrobacter sp. Helios]UPO77224.1 HAMP domain-containing histidine kinase [Arthrobacter sp. Helios]